MVEFYAAIGIEIKEKTVRTKYYRAESVSNETDEENEEETDTYAKLEKLEKKQHGRPFTASGNKKARSRIISRPGHNVYGASLLFANKIDKFSSDDNLFFQHCPI
jgi:hypothetical protein